MWFFTFHIGKALKERSYPSSEGVYIKSRWYIVGEGPFHAIWWGKMILNEHPFDPVIFLWNLLKRNNKTVPKWSV